MLENFRNHFKRRSDRLPPGFAKRCICGCQKGRLGRKDEKIGKEVIEIADKKSSCGCECFDMKPGSKNRG